MNANRQDDRVFRYVRDIIATRRRGSGVPVVFGLVRVNNATTDFAKYLEYLLTGVAEPRTGELKRAVREIFEGMGNTAIGDGTVPKLTGGSLSSSQVAELAYHVMSLFDQYRCPRSSRHDWRKDIRSWASFFVTYNAVHGDLWEGFVKTSLAKNGSPKLIYRLFLLASAITHGTRFDPTRLGDATLPPASAVNVVKFKNEVSRNPDYLDADIRAKIWCGFREEQDPHYLAANVPKPTRRPRSSSAMLEMFDCYFNCREYAYDRQAYFIEAGKTLKVAKTIGGRYWPMIGSIAMGPVICSNLLFGCWAFGALLALWRYQRRSSANRLCAIPCWGPRYTAAYAVLCALAGNTPWLALVTAIPVSVFAAHLGRQWESLKTAV